VLNGEASSLEQEELNIHLQQDEQLQQQFDLLSRIWKEKHDDIKDEDNVKANTVVSRIISRAASETAGLEVTARRKRRWNRRKSLVAGIAVIVLIAGGLIAKNYTTSSVTKPDQQQEPLITQKGSRSRTLLADGTTVWLNAGSKLVYENDFNGATREVRLEGEAFFDVVKQTKRPFIVHTSGIDIRVLGTAFNVKSYPEDKNVETTLYRGLVQVIRHEDSLVKAIQLKPNQKLILPKQAANEPKKLPEERSTSDKATPGRAIITHIDSTQKESERIETAWVYSRLEFLGENFEEVAKKMERWYNVTILFKDEKVKHLRVRGKFEKETVEEAFAALKEAFPVIKYKINDHEISVESSQ
jgi:ferric-dicitrate binding protein FerR (iron transport regulator)